MVSRGKSGVARSTNRLTSKTNIQRMVSYENKILSKKDTAVEIKMVLQSNIPTVKIDRILIFFPHKRKELMTQAVVKWHRSPFHWSLKPFIAKPLLHFPWV